MMRASELARVFKSNCVEGCNCANTNFNKCPAVKALMLCEGAPATEQAPRTLVNSVSIENILANVNKRHHGMLQRLANSVVPGDKVCYECKYNMQCEEWNNSYGTNECVGLTGI
jgi:hypothetical protein